ncbi:response regulator [Vulcaniibacterium gelatinicum]|uniref:response regulator n=1 Tax=Vulcaniibacterium gelatinicum TaxID=2598725 RepID=UPI0011CC0945|nr:response regulator transcription factor [Vulcaniibacterium gelatinicum]
MSVRVLLADDHAVVRDGLRALLATEPGIEVVGCAADGREALAAAAALRPDVVVMDINMPGFNGIEATRDLCAGPGGPKVLILSMHGSSEHVFRALQAGAGGYVLKEAAGAEVVDAVRAVAAGRRYLSRSVAETALQAFLVEGRRSRSPLESLSARERQLLQLVAEGRSNQEMAGLLSLSVKTVETYRSRLMQKLGVNDVAALVRFALDHGLA